MKVIGGTEGKTDRRNGLEWLGSKAGAPQKGEGPSVLARASAGIRSDVLPA